MIYIIHQILVLIKNHLNYLKDNIFELFLRSIIDFYFFLQNFFFFIIYNDAKQEKRKKKEEKRIKDIRNLFRLRMNKMTLQLKV